MRRAWAVILVAGLLAVPATSSAHEAVRRDGNDTRGPLDLHSAAVGHKGDSAVTHTLATFKPWKAKLLQGGSYFVVAFDTNGDPSDFERCAFAFFHGGIRGQLTNCGRKKEGKIGVLKLNGRAIRFTVGLGKLVGSDGGYGWVAFSFYRDAHACSKACGDVIPNHPPELFHDLTPPGITLRSFPDPSTDGSNTTTFPVEFGVSDHGGSGVQSWKLRQRPVGGTGWTQIADGTDSGHQSVDVSEAEGDQVEFQVIVTDRQGNRAASKPEDARVTVPIDDTDASVAFAGTWTTPAGGNTIWFQSSRHVSSTGGDTAVITYTGKELRIIGGPPASAFTVQVDGGATQPFSTTASTTRRSVVAHVSAGIGPHVATVTVTSGTFVFDAYAVSDY
ncbi:MAG: hypothetical protein M3O84_04985 [Actinomycetota bacterium]|nr:hypothetical protein [Actinomycetota bacterium]